MEWSMAGKIVIITGPTSGIGRAIAEALASHGARIVLACRDIEKGEATRATIARQTGSEALSVLQVDTSRLQSVLAFASEFKRRNRNLHVLINNAGINQPRKTLTPEGIEMTFATNVLGYYWMSMALEDILISSAPARIVNVASTFAGELDLSDLQFTMRKYTGIKA